MRKYHKNFRPNAVQKQYQASENDVKLKRNRNIPDFMKKYDIKYKDIAEYFGYSTANSFNNAHCRQDILNGIEEIIRIVEEKLTN